MKIKILIAAIFLLGVIAMSFYLKSNSSEMKDKAPISKSKPVQIVILLDLSDRIIQPGQIETDKELIIKAFDEFQKQAQSHLLMNSKDRFQVCIAHQKKLPFDKDVESEKLTIDLDIIKKAERVKRLKEFNVSLRSKLDSLYSSAYKGNDTKNYEGSNLWQFFNESLPSLLSEKVNTKVIVLTDGYFDFENRNAVLNKGVLSTTTNFISKLRENINWEAEMKKSGYGILPVDEPLKFVSVCVSEVRSKSENNLNETAMLKCIWSNWLNSNGIGDSSYDIVMHSNISNSKSKISGFLSHSI